MVKNLPANAGDMGLIPGLKDSICCRESKPGRLQLLSLCSGAGKLQLLKPFSATREATAMRSLCTETRE